MKVRRSVEEMMMLEEVEPDEAYSDSKSFNSLAKERATAEGFQQTFQLQSALNRQKTTRAERQQMLDDIQAQAARYREQIRRTNRMTLSPHSRYMQRWDVITTVALLFTATVTPFEVGIMEPSTLSQMAVDPLAWINRVVDCIFLTDIVLNCFLSYQELGEHGGAWIHDNQKIFLRYLRSYFFLDLLTALPMDVIVQGAIEMGSGGGTGDRAGIQEIAASEQPPPAFRLIRMLRLVKLGRIVRLQRIFRRWQAFWGISFGLIALIQFAVLIVIMAHWLACVWVLIGRNNAYVVPAWAADEDAWEPDPHAAFARN